MKSAFGVDHDEAIAKFGLAPIKAAGSAVRSIAGAGKSTYTTARGAGFGVGNSLKLGLRGAGMSPAARTVGVKVGGAAANAGMAANAMPRAAKIGIAAGATGAAGAGAGYGLGRRNR